MIYFDLYLCTTVFRVLYFGFIIKWNSSKMKILYKYTSINNFKNSFSDINNPRDKQQYVSV